MIVQEFDNEIGGSCEENKRIFLAFSDNAENRLIVIRYYLCYIVVLFAALCMVSCGQIGEDDIERKDTIEVDFTYDYTEDIEADVDYVVSNASSLQEEITNIEKIIQKYTLLSESALTQGEMNVASQWFYVIWDTERNNLWGRFSDLAKIKGEAFAMPELSTKYGLFVDNYGTGSVYSSLITRQDWEGGDEAIISVYRQGTLEGSFIDNGNGNLDFTSDDGCIKGTIQINGWDGATFEVTEKLGENPFNGGEKFEFPFAF